MEDIVKQCPISTLHYIQSVLYSMRWLEAEPVIARDVEYAFYYARDVIEGRFEEAEEDILENKHYKSKYNKLMEGLGINFRLKRS